MYGNSKNKNFFIFGRIIKYLLAMSVILFFPFEIAIVPNATASEVLTCIECHESGSREEGLNYAHKDVECEEIAKKIHIEKGRKNDFKKV